jgi:hypothetical protein
MITGEQIGSAKHKLDDAVWLGHLAEWIERAKHLCDHLSHCATYDEQLRDALGVHNIAYNNAGWEDWHSDGMVRLLCIQRKLMTEAIEALEVSPC